jgi:DNA-binding NtrC family response regulator
MARVALRISEPALSMTLRVMLQGEGHEIGDRGAEALLTDDIAWAAQWAQATPTLVVTPLSGVPEAVRAMRQGVYGYILKPLQPGEAGVMVARAVEGGVARSLEPELISLEEAERRHIEQVLRACKGNRTQAARILGIGRNTLWRKLKDTGPGGG